MWMESICVDIWDGWSGYIGMALAVLSSITLMRFLHICRPTADQIDLKLDRCTYYGTPGLINFLFNAAESLSTVGF